MAKYLVLIGVVPLLVVGVLACGDDNDGGGVTLKGNEVEDIRGAISRYYQAYNDRDWNEWRASISGCVFEALEATGVSEDDVLQEIRSGRASRGEAEVIEITDVLIDGDMASAAVTTKTEAGDVSTEITYWRQEDGTWLSSGDDQARCE